MFDNTWVNNDGVRVGFGVRNTINADAGEVHVHGMIKQLKCDLHADDMAAAGHTRMMEVPTDCTLIRGTFICNETFDFPMAVGTVDLDNNVLVADGIIASVTPTLGDVIDCTGALMNTMLTEPQYVIGRSATVDNITVGRGQLILEYVRNDVADV